MEAAQASETTNQVESAQAEQQNIEVVSCFIKAPTGALLSIQLTGAEQLFDVRTTILELTEVCYVTSYNLQIDGKVLPEYKELRECPDFKDGCVIEMVPAPYDERASRAHISRLQELLHGKLNSVVLTNAYVKKQSTPAAQPATTEGSAASSAPSTTPEQETSAPNAASKKQASRPTPAHHFPTFAYVQFPKSAEEIINDMDRASDADSDFTNFPNAATGSAPATSSSQPSAESGKKRSKKEQKQEITTPISPTAETVTGSEFDPLAPSMEGLQKLLIASSNEVPVRCLTSLGFSGWNPVAGSRRLAGDLLYLEAVTLEDNTFHITACTRGFYVNQSNALRFDAAQDTKYKVYHTLLGLLWEVSGKFRNQFTKLLQLRASLHPYQSLPVMHAPSLPTRVQWTALDEATSAVSNVAQQPYDMFRSEESFIASFGLDPKAPQPRDWNEEFQNYKNYACKSEDERVLRDRLLVKTHQEFAEASVRGAKAVVDGLLQPFNPNEAASQHVWIHNNIFFSIVCDIRNIFKNYGGDEGAHKMAKIDLHGSASYEELEVEGLHSVMTVVVDYKGRRVLAQAMIQGMIQNQADSFSYGLEEDQEAFLTNADGAAPEEEKKKPAIIWDEKTHERLVEAANKLYIKCSPVVNKNAREDMLPVVNLAAAIETKAFVGWDKRTYLLDVIRPAPRDANWLDVPTAVLRTELVRMFNERKKSEHMEKKLKEFAAERKAKKEAAAAASSQQKEAAEDESSKLRPEALLEGFEPTLFNVNCFTEKLTEHELAMPEEEKKKDEDDVRTLSEFLIKTAIPTAIVEAVESRRPVLDGQSLVDLLHDNGINMRYLGEVAKQCAQVPQLQALCMQEMVVRAAKHELNVLIAKTEQTNVAQAISGFLNALLGSQDEEPATTAESSEAKPEESAGKKKKKAKKHDDSLASASQQVHRAIVEQVKRRFRFDLPLSFFISPAQQLVSLLDPIPEGPQKSPVSHQHISHLPALRSLCMKTGVQVACKDYDFSSRSPFSPSDILDLLPVVAHHIPSCKGSSALLASASEDLLYSRDLDSALQKTLAALQYIQTVYGPISAEYLEGLKVMCQVYVQANELETALLTFHKALSINRRINGVDHHSNVQLHQTMGAVLGTMEKPTLALKHCLRAAYLNTIISPTLNIESPNLMTSIGNLYHESGDVPRALIFFREGIKASVAIFGETNLQTALLSQQFAVFLSRAIGQHRGALEFQKRAIRTMQLAYGNDDPRCIEAAKLLEEFTQAAVEAQKEVLSQIMSAQQQQQTSRPGSSKQKGGKAHK